MMVRRWVGWCCVVGVVSVCASCGHKPADDGPAQAPEARAVRSSTAQEVNQPTQPLVPEPKTSISVPEPQVVPTPMVKEVNQPAKPSAVETQDKPAEPGVPAQAKVEPVLSGRRPSPIAEANDSTVIARIGDYTITGGEFKKRFFRDLYPSPYDPTPSFEPVDSQQVLMRMLGEKAMIMEGRAQGCLKLDMIAVPVKRTREQQLAVKTVQQALSGKLAVTDQEIQEEVQKDPKLQPERAKQIIQQRKAVPLFEQYYQQLCQKLRLRKVSEEFPKVAAVHKRLSEQPGVARRQTWILNQQLKDEIDPNDKSIVLAHYEGGSFTLLDWFEALCEIVPPSRPKDLNTPEGVERLLDKALQRPLLAAEARLLMIDQDSEYVASMRQLEDQYLLGYMESEQRKGAAEPTEAEVKAYFEKAKSQFAGSEFIKVEVIWLENRSIAQQVRVELDKGGDFKVLQKQYATDKNALDPVDLSPSSEGIFWPRLWQSEPNEVVGPILGFREEGFKWRIAKVLEKKPGQAIEFSDTTKDMVKWDLMEKNDEKNLAEYRKTLLAKYPYQVSSELLSRFDPRQIP